MKVTPGRRAALQTLRSVGRGRRADLAMEESARDLSSRERRWVHQLVYGVMRLRGRVDHILDHHLHAGTRGVSPLLLDLLRLGAYELLHMGGTPAYAAISQAVDQARGRGGRGAASLVNAVLRGVSRGGEDPAIFPDRESDPEGYLATWGSHPRWMVKRWLERWDAEEVGALVEFNNGIPPVYLRPVGASPGEVARILAREGTGVRAVGEGTECLELPAGTDIKETLATLPAIVQDPGASLVAAYAAPGPNDVVADLCAAPGGKALAFVGRPARLIAADPSVPRLRVLRDNASRLNVRVGIVAARAQAPPLTSVDIVLLDVPCTGTGTLRRHPDARWRLTPDDLDSMAGLQDEILDGGATIVPKGGLLVYSTCSLEPEENQERVRSFVKKHPGYRLEGVSTVGDRYRQGEFLAVLPQRTGFDGAFAARLRRVA